MCSYLKLESDKDAECERLRVALEKTREQAESMKDYAHEGDKVICGIGQIQKLVAVALHPSEKTTGPGRLNDL